MEAVNYLTNWIKWLIPVVVAGTVFRVTYCFFKLVTSPDDTANIKKSMKNTLVAGAIMITLTSFIEMLKIILS